MANNMTMLMVNIADMKAKLSEYLDAVARGEQVIICKRNRPVAELRPIEPARTGRRDLTPMFPGETFITEAFFEPLTEEELREWEGADVSPARVAETPATYDRSSPRRRKGPRRA
jgi:prevent-host-death family protein